MQLFITDSLCLPSLVAILHKSKSVPNFSKVSQLLHLEKTLITRIL